ncbi:IS66 family insertion sequence element accessory protein TnpA, partial [Leucothrix pacifica]
MARRTQAQWQSLIQQFEQSGLSQVAFCQQHELNPTYFSLRRSKLRAMKTKTMPASRFVEASPMTPD